MGLGINLVGRKLPILSQCNTNRLQLITLALVTGPYLYQRVSLIQSVQNNAPGKLQSRSAFSSYEVKFADRIRNCEDVILLDGLDGVALLSCDEARDRWNTVMVSEIRLCLSGNGTLQVPFKGLQPVVSCLLSVI